MPRASGPVLLHCTAGKDRTGVMVALLLLAAGVAPEVVVDDYARTAEALEELLDQLRTLPVFAERLAALPAEALTARPAVMAAFIDYLNRHLGGVRAYLASCGLTDDDLAALSAALVEVPA